MAGKESSESYIMKNIKNKISIVNDLCYYIYNVKGGSYVKICY